MSRKKWLLVFQGVLSIWQKGTHLFAGHNGLKRRYQPCYKEARTKRPRGSTPRLAEYCGGWRGRACQSRYGEVALPGKLGATRVAFRLGRMERRVTVGCPGLPPVNFWFHGDFLGTESLVYVLKL